MGSTLLYLGLALAILAQTIPLPAVSGNAPPASNLATLEQVPAAPESESVLNQPAPHFEWLPLVGIVAALHASIQFPIEPELSVAALSSPPDEPAPAGDVPPAPNASLASADFLLKFDSALFRFRPAPRPFGTPAEFPRRTYRWSIAQNQAFKGDRHSALHEQIALSP